MPSVESALLELEEFVSNVEGRHDGNPLGADNATPVPDFPSFLIQVAGCEKELMLFILGAGDRVLLAENLDLDRGIGFTHAGNGCVGVLGADAQGGRIMNSGKCDKAKSCLWTSVLTT